MNYTRNQAGKSLQCDEMGRTLEVSNCDRKLQISDFRTLGLFDVFEVFEGFRGLKSNKMLNYLIVIYNIYIIYNYSIRLCKLKIAKSPKVLSSFSAQFCQPLSFPEYG